jgi:hypothetical protein
MIYQLWFLAVICGGPDSDLTELLLAVIPFSVCEIRCPIEV